MGAWGVAIFSDDLAADLKGDFRDLIGEGLTAGEAVERLRHEYAASVEDADEGPVFWIALACVQWKLGRVDEATRERALAIIESGADLRRWEGRDRDRRAAVLEKVRQELLSPPPAAKRVPRRIIEANEWEVGEVVAFQLLSGKWVLMRVIGHHVDKGGVFAVCELLDWVGESFASAEVIARLPVKQRLDPSNEARFLFQEPRKKSDQARVRQLGISSTPVQPCTRYSGFVWPFVDELFRKNYGLE